MVKEALDMRDVAWLRVEVSHDGTGAGGMFGKLFNGVADEDVGVLGGGG